MQQHELDWVGKWAVYSPDEIAITEFESNRSLTYSSLDKAANAVAEYLFRIFSVRSGDRIAVLAENCLEYVVLFSAAQKLGFILVPLNYRLTTSEIEALLMNAEPILLISEYAFSEKIPSVTMPVIAVESLLEEAYRQYTATSFAGNHTFSDPLFILYTSGTTGTPKGVIYTHAMLFWNSINTQLRLDITSDDHALSCTPMFHTGGWNVLLTPFLHHGAKITLMKRFLATEAVQILSERRISMFMAVPTMLNFMARTAEFTHADFSILRYIIVGGEPMPIPEIELWHSKGVPIRQGYGLTEAGPSITSLHQRDAISKAGSIGTPNFYLSIRIIHDDGQLVKAGERGELLLGGDVVTPGYWRNPTATEAAFSNGFLRTGDIVTQDADGYLWVVDRKKNMYISGGENVYPAEVEHLAEKMPGMRQCCIVPVPDAKWGEAGVALYTTQPDVIITAQELKSYLRERVASYKIPKHAFVLDELPLGKTGKIDRKRLTDIALELVKNV